MASATGAARDPLTGSILAAAIEVHRHLGPGLLESIYETCLDWELRARGFDIEVQMAVPVMYKDVVLPLVYRLDLVVEHRVIIEVKAVDRLHPMTTAQVLTYLKLTRLRTALILNFNVPMMRD